MASIVERTRKNGTVGYQIRWLEDGRQQATTAENAKDARRIKAIVEATGTFTEAMGRPDVPTVNAQVDTYLTQHTRANAATRGEYQRIITQHITPVLGDVAVTACTPELLKMWATGLTRHDRGHVGEPLSEKSRANVTAVLSGVLESAVPEWLPANPWRKVRLEANQSPRVERAMLRPSDLGLILAEIPEHYRPLVATLGMTGMRWGEAAALTVGDATVVKGLPTFRVTKAVKHRAAQADLPGRPKTGKAVRTVTGPPELAPVLEPLLTRPKSAPLFPTVTGKRLRNSTFHTLVWQPALNRATANGLPFRPRIHDLRAAATTWLIEAGMRMDEVADLMGHESVETTSRIYRRSNPEAGRKAAAAMSGILSEATRALPG